MTSDDVPALFLEKLDKVRADEAFRTRNKCCFFLSHAKDLSSLSRLIPALLRNETG